MRVELGCLMLVICACTRAPDPPVHRGPKDPLTGSSTNAASPEVARAFGPRGFRLGGSPGFAGGDRDRLLGADLDRQSRLVAVGFSRTPDGAERGLIVRYRPDGSLDPSFGGGTGFILGIEPGGPGSFHGSAPNQDRFRAVRVDREGRILVAGSSRDGDRKVRALLARYTPEGRLDPTFGAPIGSGPARRGYIVPRFSSYRVLALPDERLVGLDLDPDGKIVVAGVASELRRAWFYRTVVARFTADGELDRSFDSAPAAPWWTGADDELMAVRALPDRRVLAAGWTASPRYEERTLLARYTSEGHLDPSWTAPILGPERSHAGAAKEVLAALALDPQRSLIYAAGFSFDAGHHIRAYLERRADPTGALDPTFGSGGLIVEDPRRIADSDVEYLVAVTFDTKGRPVAAGFTDDRWAYGEEVDRAILVRYSRTGTASRRFQSWRDGRSIFAGGTDDAFQALASDLEHDRIYAAGTSGGQTLVARFRPDGSLDSATLTATAPPASP